MRAAQLRCAVYAALVGAGCRAAATPVSRGSDARAVAHTTSATAALAEWVSVYNAGNTDSMQAFITRRFAASALARSAAADRAQSNGWVFLNVGRVEIVEIDSVSGDTLASAVIRQPMLGAWGRARARVTSDAPHAYVAAGLSAYLEDAPVRYSNRSASPTLNATRVREIARALDVLATADAFSGVVLIARGDSILLHRAYGLADRERRTPNRLDTRFELASVGKMFTAVALATLVERGRLAYRDTLAALLPEYPNRSVASRLTLHHLLTHTSGLRDYLEQESYQTAKRSGQINTLKDVWPFFAPDTLDFAPGSRVEYSNSNFALIGATIERVSGVRFADFLRQRVFDPAQMRDTWASLDSLAPRAIGYTRFDGSGPDLRAWHRVPPAGVVGGPAGGGTATALDLFRFARALTTHKLLSAEITDSVMRGRVDSGPGERNGYGFDETMRRGVRFVGHNGGFMGTYNEVDIYPELGYTSVLLSNVDVMGARAAAEAIRRNLAAR